MPPRKEPEERKNESQPAKISIFSRIKTIVTSDIFKVCVGLLLFFGSCFLTSSLVSYLFTGADDQNKIDNLSFSELTGLKQAEIANWGGAIGAYVAEHIINYTFGVPILIYLYFLFVLSLSLIREKSHKFFKLFLFSSLWVVWLSLLLGVAASPFYADSFFYWGGIHGHVFGEVLFANLGKVGTYLLLVVTLLILVVTMKRSTVSKLQYFFSFEWLKFKKKEKPTPDAFTQETEEVQGEESDEENTDTESEELNTAEKDGLSEIKEIDDPFELEEEENTYVEEQPLRPIIDEPNFQPVVPPIASEPPIAEVSESEIIMQHLPENEILSEAIQPDYDPTLELSRYMFPSFELLTKYEVKDAVLTEEEMAENKNRITETLRNYGITITDIKAVPGPTITLYKIVPDAGIRIQKIRSLEDDIALSLAALGIRIIAPIPGESAVGIEVPNKKPQMVPMHSIIASKKFQESTFDLPIAFGKTITNEIFMVDLCKMPHILVAGATGQGKSVGLNAIITSLLYKKHPSQLKFVLVDPKKVEFNIYAHIEKHFLAKLPNEEEAIITDVTKVVQTLNSLTIEMDERYDLLKKAGTRNIKEYNERFVKRRLNPEKGHRYLPYIVVIIDEFGDLIMTAGKEVELPIARIAQLARAVGIHMIIATQRPSTNIITGIIKANFPARVAFRVSSMIDSRTILDSPGANQLIGRGDMLFVQGSETTRVQCAFIDTPEVENVTQFIGDQLGYPSAFHLPEAQGGEDGAIVSLDSSERDPKFEEAARLVVMHQQGSTSLIQRQMSLGFNRAGRIMDQLERSGIVGPANGSKPREVLVFDDVQLDAVLNRNR